MLNINRFYIFLFAIFSSIGIACADVLIIRFLIDTEGVDVNPAIEEKEAFFYYGGQEVDGADLGIDVTNLEAQINPIVLDTLPVDDANAAALAEYQPKIVEMITSIVESNAAGIGANDIFIQFQQDYESLNGVDASFIMSGASGALAGGVSNVFLADNAEVAKEGSKYIIVNFYQDWFDPLWRPPALDIVENLKDGTHWSTELSTAYGGNQNKLVYRVITPQDGGPPLTEGPYVIGGAGGYNVHISSYIQTLVLDNIHELDSEEKAISELIEMDPQAVIKCLAGVPPDQIRRVLYTKTGDEVQMPLSADECPNQSWTGTGSGSPLDENPATIQDIINFHEAEYAIVNVNGFYRPIELESYDLTTAHGLTLSGSTYTAVADYSRDNRYNNLTDLDWDLTIKYDIDFNGHIVQSVTVKTRTDLKGRTLREHCFFVEFEMDYDVRVPGYEGRSRKYWVNSADSIVNLDDSKGLVDVPILTVKSKYGFTNPSLTLYLQGSKKQYQYFEDCNYFGSHPQAGPCNIWEQPARTNIMQFSNPTYSWDKANWMLLMDYLKIPATLRAYAGHDARYYVPEPGKGAINPNAQPFRPFRYGTPFMIPDPYYKHFSADFYFHEGQMITYIESTVLFAGEKAVAGNWSSWEKNFAGDWHEASNDDLEITVVGTDGVSPKNAKYNTISGVNVLDFPHIKYGRGGPGAVYAASKVDNLGNVYIMASITSRYGNQTHYIGNVVCERNADFSKDPDDGEWKNFTWTGAPYACSATDGYGGMTLTASTPTLTLNGHGTTVQIGGDEVTLRVSTGVDTGGTIALDLRRCSQNLHFFDNYCKASDGTESVAYTGDQMCAADELCLLRDEQVLLPYPKTHMDGMRRNYNGNDDKDTTFWANAHIDNPDGIIFWPYHRHKHTSLTDRAGNSLYTIPFAKFEQDVYDSTAIPFPDPRYNSFWVPDEDIDDATGTGCIGSYTSNKCTLNHAAAIRTLGEATGGNFSSVDRRSPLEGSEYTTLLDLWGRGSTVQLEYNQSHAHQCIPKDVLKGEKQVSGNKVPIFSNNAVEVANGSICEGLIFEKLTTVSFDYPVTIVMQDTDSADPDNDVVTVTFNIASGLEHPDPDDDLDAGTVLPAICVPYRHGGHRAAIENFDPMKTFIDGGSYGRLDPTPTVKEDVANGNDGNVPGFPGPYCKDHDTTDGFDPCEWYPDKHPDSD